MREPVPERDRWLALAILVVLLALGYLVLVHPWWTVPMREAGERIERLQQRDLRVRMELEQAPEVQQRLAEVQAAAAGMPGFMDERSTELATAALVARLETAVLEVSPGNRSCAIRNRAPLSEARPGRFRKAVVQVRLHCGNTELAAVLHALESGAPRLFVDNLNVLAPQQGFGGTGADGFAPGAGLDVSFELHGYLAPAGAGPDPAAGAANGGGDAG